MTIQGDQRFLRYKKRVSILSRRSAAVCVLLLLLTSAATAQRQNNIWYFGNGTGLDFNVSPPALLRAAAINTSEGSASIADPVTGKLLFYTDGRTIINRRHVVMANGEGLSGHWSTSQSALIVPVPGTKSRYYVFTNGPYDGGINSQSGMLTSIRYSIVDMTLANGDGAVVTKNTLLLDSTNEKMHAVAIRDGNEFWLVAHRWDNDNFYAVRISASGMAPPVLSAAGYRLNSWGFSIGCIKLSIDGRHLAMSYYDVGAAYLFDFDTATGIVSDPIELGWSFAGYGLCFSPDGSKLYCGGRGMTQFDLSSGDSATILASRHVLDTWESGPYYGTLTLGPDSKIYCAVPGNRYLGVIENPNVRGPSCRMIREGVKLELQSGLGLPNMVEFIPPRQPDTVRDINFYLPTLCQGHTERVAIPFHNRRTTDSAVSITFTGQRARDYTLDTTLPFALTPTTTITFPVIHRWTVPGSWTTTAVMRTTSGTVYLLNLHAVTEGAIKPVLDLSTIHLGRRDRPFDTCITVTNIYSTRLLLDDTVWQQGSRSRLRLASSTLPFYLGPGASARLCLQGNMLDTGEVLSVMIGGRIVDPDYIGRCVIHLLEIDARDPIITTAVPLADDGDRSPTRLECAPNPASGAMHIIFTMRERGHVRVRLMSMEGIEIATLADAMMDAGPHRTEVDVSHLPSGMYLAHVEFPDGVESRVVAIVR